MTKIYKDKIKEIHNNLNNYGIEEKKIMAILLYGSQSLGLEDRESDLDIILYTTPTANELFYSASKIKEFTNDKNEKIIIRKTTHILNSLKRMELQFVESFFNPLYINANLENQFSFDDEFYAIHDVFWTPQAQAMFKRTLYFVACSYTIKEEKLNTSKLNKNKAKLYLYYQFLNGTLDIMKSYSRNKLTDFEGNFREDILETYHHIKNNGMTSINLYETILEYLDNEIDTYHDFIKEKYDVSLTKEYKEAERLIINNTISRANESGQ